MLKSDPAPLKLVTALQSVDFKHSLSDSMLCLVVSVEKVGLRRYDCPSKPGCLLRRTAVVAVCSPVGSSLTLSVTESVNYCRR